MFATQRDLIIDALREIAPPDKQAAVDTLATVLGGYVQELDHGGKITLSGMHDKIDREYSGFDANNLLPTPPVKPPIVDVAMLKVSNAPHADSDKRGDNGFAIDVEGITRTDQLWAIKWATVGSTSQAGSYWHSDGFETNNSQGDTVSEVPIRVFFQNEEALPTAGDVVGYVRDVNGLAYGSTSHLVGISGFDPDDFTEVTLVTDVQFNGTNFQKKTLTCKVYNPDENSVSEWTNITGGDTTEVTVVIDNDFDGTNFRHNHRTARVFDPGAAGGLHTISGGDTTEVTVVVDVDVSGVTLRESHRTARVLDPGAATGLTAYHTGATC